MVGRSVPAEPLNSLSLNRPSAHRDGFALPSESLKRMAVARTVPVSGVDGLASDGRGSARRFALPPFV